MTNYARPPHQAKPRWHTLSSNGLRTLCGLRVSANWEWGVPRKYDNKCLRCDHTLARRSRAENKGPEEYLLIPVDRSLVHLAFEVALQFTEEEMLDNVRLSGLHPLLQAYVALALTIMAEHATITDGLVSDVTEQNAIDAKALLARIGAKQEWLRKLMSELGGSTFRR